MNFKTTLALVLLLSVVGGYFYFVEYGQTSRYEVHKQQQADETTQTAGQLVFADDTPALDSIDRIQITRGGREVTIEKHGGQWFQTQPVRFALETSTPDAIARRFAELRYIQQMESDASGAAVGVKSGGGATTAQMGLDKPRAVVTVWVGDKHWTLKLGRQTVDGHGYVQVDGEMMAYVVDPALHGAVLDQQVNDWRSKSLGIQAASAIEHIGLHQDGAVIGLTKADGRWRIDGEGVQRASEEAINNLVAAADQVWINGFTEDNPDSLAIYGLGKPHLELIIESPALLPPTDNQVARIDTVTRRLKIGRTALEGNTRYAAWTRDDEPTLVVFTVDASSADALVRSVDDLRDPRVVVASPQDVRDLVVQQAGETTLHLIRDPQSGYRFGEPQPDFDVDYSTAHALIQHVCGLETTRYTTELSELGDPIVQVQLGVAAGGGEVNFNVYGSGDDRIIVNRGEGVGYLVKVSGLDLLLGPPLGLRKRTIMDISRDKITGMTLRRADGVVYEFIPSDAETGWTLTGQDQFENTSFDALLGSLNPLRATKWLADPITPDTGEIELTINLSEGSPKTLSIDPVNGQAVLTGIDLGFVLPGVVADLFNAEYRDRSVLTVSLEEIASARIASDTTDIMVSLDGQRFVSDQGEVDQAVAAGVFDALAGLRVERYVAPLHLRPEDIDFSIELTTTGEETWTLRFIHGDDETVTVTMDPSHGESHTGWFTLNRDAVDRLRAPLTGAEALIK